MPIYLQPSDLTDQGNALFNTLGTFWTSFYEGSDLLRDYIRGRAEAGLQTLQDLHELVECTSRVELPVFHRERWQPLRLLQSEQLDDARLTYAASDNLGAAANSTLSNRTFDYAFPEGFQDGAFIMDTIGRPTVLLTKDVDFIVDYAREAIRFLQDPFVLLAGQPVYSGSSVSDRELTLWIGQADFDRRHLAEQFGYAVKLQLESSEKYKTLLNALWDADLSGTVREHLDQVLSALCDAPLAESDGEVVEAIVNEPDRKLVITDQQVYICGSAATVLVAVGQELKRGDRLVDAFEVIDLSQGTPAADQLASLTLPTSHLKGSYTGGLTFQNADVSLTVTTVATRTRVEFALGGAGADQTLFWDTVHANGISGSNQTLAQLLDTRTPPQSTDPDATSLPTVINPLDFLVKNILRYGLTVIRITPASFGANALSTSLMDTVLRALFPPQGGYLTITVS